MHFFRFRFSKEGTLVTMAKMARVACVAACLSGIPSTLLAACGNAEGPTSPVESTATEFEGSSVASLTAERVTVLPPLRSSGPERLLVLFPGTGLGPSRYLRFAAALQAASPLRLWVAIPPFFRDLPLEPESEARYQESLAAAKSKGFADARDETTFLSGHSLGGIAADFIANRHPLAGLVFFGSYATTFPFHPQLEDLRPPVLTLGGELDGFTWVTRLALEVDKATALEKALGHAKVVTDKPVIIAPGINHGGFVDAFVDERDLVSDVSENAAHQRVSEWVANFMALHSGDPSLFANGEPYRALEKGVESTRTLLGGYLEARRLERGAWCETAQRTLLGDALPPGAALSIRTEEVTNDWAFSFSKPELTVKEGQGRGATVEIYVPFRNRYASDPLDGSASAPESATQMACKLKSRDAVAKALGTSPAQPAPSCRDINQLAIDEAYGRLAPSSLARYKERGRKLVVGDDDVKGVGPSWLFASLTLERDERAGTALVRSPSLVTGVGNGWLDGMHYCTLLSPARAVEWLLVEGFKR